MLTSKELFTVLFFFNFGLLKISTIKLSQLGQLIFSDLTQYCKSFLRYIPTPPAWDRESTCSNRSFSILADLALALLSSVSVIVVIACRQSLHVYPEKKSILCLFFGKDFISK